MKLKIAIVDRNEEFSSLAHSAIKKLNKLSTIDKYYNIEDFLTIENETHYDVVFIDYKQSADDEFKLLSMQFIKKSLTIIMMDEENFLLAIEGYKFDIFRLILKNRFSEEVEDLLDAIELALSKPSMIRVKSKGTYRTINIDELNAVRIEGRNIIFVLDDMILKSRMDKTIISEKLMNDNFIKANKTTYINLNRAKTIEDDEIIMNNQQKYLFSRAFKKAFIENFLANK